MLAVLLLATVLSCPYTANENPSILSFPLSLLSHNYSGIAIRCNVRLDMNNIVNISLSVNSLKMCHRSFTIISQTYTIY